MHKSGALIQYKQFCMLQTECYGTFHHKETHISELLFQLCLETPDNEEFIYVTIFVTTLINTVMYTVFQDIQMVSYTVILQQFYIIYFKPLVISYSGCVS